MRKGLTRLAFSVTIAVTAVHHSGRASATKPEGYKSTLLAVGRFSEIDVLSHSVSSDQANARHKADVWLSLQEGLEGSIRPMRRRRIHGMHEEARACTLTLVIA